MKRLLIITSTRADYGLLKSIIIESENNHKLQSQLLVTGTHLDQEYGYTINEIEEDGIKIHKKLKLELIENEHLSLRIAKSIQKFSYVLQDMNPDLLMILGDRYEIFSMAIVAYTMKIPIAHIHGGEITQGALDEGFRHSISKMASIHFPVTNIYRDRLISMGENPKYVFNFGAPMVDTLNKLERKSLKELEVDLKFKLRDKPYVICTFHPETIEQISIDIQISNLLDALKKKSELRVIFTMPNCDPGNEIIREKINEYVINNSDQAMVIESLGVQRYISLLSKCICMVGNSSSGLSEAPMLGVPTVNIGNRQKGRYKPETVISCANESKKIEEAIEQCMGLKRDKCMPFGNGGTSKKIIDKIIEIDLNTIVDKEFYESKET